MALPSYEELVGSTRLPSYDELVSSSSPVPDEIAQSEAQQEIERNAKAPEWLGRALGHAQDVGKEAFSSILPPEMMQGIFGGSESSLRPVERSKPLISLEASRQIVGQLPAWAGGNTEFGKGAAESAAGALYSFSSPASLAQLPAFAIPGVAETYAANVLSELPDQGRKLVETANKYGWNSKETGQVAAEYGITDLTGFLAGRHGTLGHYVDTARKINAAPEVKGAEVPKPSDSRPVAAGLSPVLPQKSVRTEPVPSPADVTPARVADTGYEQPLTPDLEKANPKNVSQSQITTPLVEPSTPESSLPDPLQHSREYIKQRVSEGATIQQAVAELNKLRDEYEAKTPSVSLRTEEQPAPPVSREAGKEAASEPAKVPGQNAPFVPSTEWQEVPDGTILPNWGEYRFDQKSGKNFARWKPEDLPASVPVQESVRTESVPSPSSAISVGEPAPDVARFAENDRIASPSVDPVVSQPENTPSTTGVANRVLEEEAKAGRIDPIASGEGMSWQEMVDLGRQEINAGADPQAIARRFQRNKRISPTDFAVLRAERERLAVETNKAEDAIRANPSDPVARDAYNQARKTEVDWIQKVVQPAKTSTSDIFRGMQGEAPIDASTFAGLRRAVLDEKGREIRPHEVQPLEQVASKVQRATQAEAVARKRLSEVVKQITKDSVPKTADELRAHFAERIRKLTPC